jgi:hypothetical protein
MKGLLRLGIMICCILHLHAQEPGSQSVYFSSGSHELSKDAIRELDAQFDQRVPAKVRTQITIKAYTDHTGNPHSNQILAEQRAKAVEAYYRSKGISQAQLHTLNMGPVKPSTGRNTEEERKKNRRVDILCYTEEPPPVSASLPVSPPNPEPQLSQPKQETSMEDDDIQLFQASPKKNIKLTGKKGTVIKIPQNSLVDSKGNLIKTDIVIELTEVYSQYDMILHHVQTVSDGELLESAGMVYIRITSQGQELSLASNASYQIEFPTKHKVNDMNIFYGNGNGKSLNWKQAASNYTSDNSYIENIKQLDKYIFNGTKFGWINCDHFMGKANITRLQVSLSDTVGMNLCLVLKNINSVMIIGNTKNGFQSPDIPVGQAGTLVWPEGSHHK